MPKVYIGIAFLALFSNSTMLENYSIFFINNEVIKPMITIARQEQRNLSKSNKANPANTISPSINIITIAILTEVVFEITLASKSVPPVLVSYLSISATPTPIKTPPIKAPTKLETSNWELIGESKSINKEEINNPCKLLKKYPL